MQMTRTLISTTLGLCIALMAPGTVLANGHTPTPEQIAQNCAEAENRYVELFGKPSAEEDGVTVVSMYKFTFCPVNVTVTPGTTIRWVNVDKRTSHSVWFRDEGKPESDRLFSTETVEMTFETPGEFRYLCGPHWESHGMIGDVIVTP